jgi:hypothetical protein
MTPAQESGMDRLKDAMTATHPSITAAMESPRDGFLKRVAAELDRAYSKHGRDPWGRHEFYGVLKEEVDELWDAIKSDLPMEDVLSEVAQIACVCLRYVETGDRYRGPTSPAATPPRAGSRYRYFAYYGAGESLWRWDAVEGTALWLHRRMPEGGGPNPEASILEPDVMRGEIPALNAVVILREWSKTTPALATVLSEGVADLEPASEPAVVGTVTTRFVDGGKLEPMPVEPARGDDEAEAAMRAEAHRLVEALVIPTATQGRIFGPDDEPVAAIELSEVGNVRHAIICAMIEMAAFARRPHPAAVREPATDAVRTAAVKWATENYHETVPTAIKGYLAGHAAALASAPGTGECPKCQGYQVAIRNLEDALKSTPTPAPAAVVPEELRKRLAALVAPPSGLPGDATFTNGIKAGVELINYLRDHPEHLTPSPGGVVVKPETVEAARALAEGVRACRTDGEPPNTSEYVHELNRLGRVVLSDPALARPADAASAGGEVGNDR